jgi:hypothetical protein
MKNNFDQHEMNQKPVWNKEQTWRSIETLMAKEHSTKVIPIAWWQSVAAAILFMACGFGLGYLGKNMNELAPLNNKIITDSIYLTQYKVDTLYIEVLKDVINTTKSNSRIIVKNIEVHDTIWKDKYKEVFAFKTDTIILDKQIIEDNKPINTPDIMFAFNPPIGELKPRSTTKFRLFNRSTSNAGRYGNDIFLVLK